VNRGHTSASRSCLGTRRKTIPGDTGAHCAGQVRPAERPIRTDADAAGSRHGTLVVVGLRVMNRHAGRVTSTPSSEPTPPRTGAAIALAAFLVGVMYAGMSAYWGLGGTGLLDTIGGTLEREGRAGNAGLLVVLRVTVVLNPAAAILGLFAVLRPRWVCPRHRQVARASSLGRRADPRPLRRRAHRRRPTRPVGSRACIGERRPQGAAVARLPVGPLVPAVGRAPGCCARTLTRSAIRVAKSPAFPGR